MADAHRQMLDLVIAAVTALPSTGSRVYEEPADAIQGKTFPSLIVEPQDVDPTILGEGHEDEWREKHRLTVAVTTVAEDVASRDQSSVEVKNALLVVNKLGKRRRYAGSAFGRRGEGDRQLVAIINRFEIDYLVDNTAPDVIRA